MIDTRDELLIETALLYGRSMRVLDPIRLRVWDNMGIAQPQLRILFQVRARPDIDLRSLAESLGISPSAASQQVDKLVERELLARTPDPADRRRLQLNLTDLGRAATRALSRASHNYVQEILQGLSDDDLRTFHELLEKILDRADQIPVPSGFAPEDIELEKSLRRR